MECSIYNATVTFTVNDTLPSTHSSSHTYIMHTNVPVCTSNGESAYLNHAQAVAQL